MTKKPNVVRTDLPLLNFVSQVPSVADYKTPVKAELGILRQEKNSFQESSGPTAKRGSSNSDLKRQRMLAGFCLYL